MKGYAAPDPPSPAQGFVLLVVAVFGWELTWPVNKVILESMSPLWMAAIRSAIAAVTLLAVSLTAGRLVVPPRSDWPVLLSITLLHMVGFAILAAVGLQLVSVGRSVVLAYTTPLWVTPGAAIFLGEKLTLRRIIGVTLGLIGLGVLFSPFALDLTDRKSLVGQAALLIAALLWAASILHIRGHKWKSTPFQLVPWEMFLATIILFVIAFIWGPHFEVNWNANLIALLFVTSVLGTTIAYWAIAMAGRSLSAVTVSLGLLGAPIIGIVIATITLGEPPDLSVWIAVVLVLGGVAIGATGERWP